MLSALAGAACGPVGRVVLPTGSGTPTSEYSAAFASAVARCREMTTLQGELGLSGNAGRQKLRGRLLAGFAPGAMRLEGVAPFGSPVFILTADGPRGTLLLPRDRRVLQNTAPEDILNALIGVKLGADDLRDALGGCVKPRASASSGLAFGPDWMSVEVGSGTTVWLRREGEGGGGWRMVAARLGELQIEYTKLATERPAQMVIRAPNAAVAVTVNQITVNADLPRDQLVAIQIPPGTQPVTLDELRNAGPLGEP